MNSLEDAIIHLYSTTTEITEQSMRDTDGRAKSTENLKESILSNDINQTLISKTTKNSHCPSIDTEKVDE